MDRRLGWLESLQRHSRRVRRLPLPRNDQETFSGEKEKGKEASPRAEETRKALENKRVLPELLQEEQLQRRELDEDRAQELQRSLSELQNPLQVQGFHSQPAAAVFGRLWKVAGAEEVVEAAGRLQKETAQPKPPEVHQEWIG